MGLVIEELITCELCDNYSITCQCTSENPSIQKQFKDIGKSHGKSCGEFKSKNTTTSYIIQNHDALKFMLAGKSEFILISNKTNVNIHYKLERKLTSGSEENLTYWVYTLDNSGFTVYAGIIYHSLDYYRFRYERGVRGKLGADEVEIKSLLYTLNNLLKSNYSIEVTVKHKGRCGGCRKSLIDTFSLSHGLDIDCYRKVEIPR